METLPNGLTLRIPTGCFPLSTDSILLANFTKPGTKVLDLGAGCGTLGLLLCADHPKCEITGLELDPDAHAAALRNIADNRISHRIHSICADLRTVRDLLPSGSFDTCVSNPPYFPGGPASKQTPLARREDCCAPAELFAAASWALKTGGDFYLVHKPERLAQLCACASASMLEPKRLRLIRHRADGPVSLILLQCRKGGKPGLIWEERSLHTADGRPTPYYQELYHEE